MPIEVCDNNGRKGRKNRVDITQPHGQIEEAMLRDYWKYNNLTIKTKS